MSSRFTQSMQMKARQFRKRQGNESFTTRERKFYNRKVILLPNGGFLIESIEHHLERMKWEAELERAFPTEWWRHLARVYQVFNKLDFVERDLVKRALKLEQTVAWTEQAIARYRRLTNRLQDPLDPLVHALDPLVR